MKINFVEAKIEEKVYAGQVRKSDGGRVVLIVTEDERYELIENGDESTYFKAVVLQEEGGWAEPFQSLNVRCSDEDILSKYPHLLEAEMNIYEK